MNTSLKNTKKKYTLKRPSGPNDIDLHGKVNIGETIEVNVPKKKMGKVTKVLIIATSTLAVSLGLIVALLASNNNSNILPNTNPLGQVPGAIPSVEQNVDSAEEPRIIATSYSGTIIDDLIKTTDKEYDGLLYMMLSKKIPYDEYTKARDNYNAFKAKYVTAKSYTDKFRDERKEAAYNVYKVYLYVLEGQKKYFNVEYSDSYTSADEIDVEIKEVTDIIKAIENDKQKQVSETYNKTAKVFVKKGYKNSIII